MDIHLIWQAILIVLMGTILLRVAGRKTISEMTLAETVLMISIGTLIIQPVTSDSVWTSFFIGLTLVFTLLILEYAQMKSHVLEKLITGKAKVVIEDGVINDEELMKLHLTIDQLEMHLRQNNIASVRDVKIATIEPSGRLGFMLKKGAQPATKRDIEQLQESVDELLMKLTHTRPTQASEKKDTSQQNNHLFFEVKHKEHQ